MKKDNPEEADKETEEKIEKKPMKKLMKFYYGFATKIESYWRVLKTKDYFMGVLFTDWGEDERLTFNGTEWTTLYYYTCLEKVCPERY